MQIPTLAKVILWLSLLGGAWNGLVGSIFLISPPPESVLLEAEGMKLILTLTTFLGIYFAVSSILALRQSETGRKAFSFGLIFLAVLTVLYVGIMIAQAPQLPIIIAVGIGMIIPLSILFILHRYFNSQTVLKAYLTTHPNKTVQETGTVPRHD